LFSVVADAIASIEEYPDGWPPLPGWDRGPIVRSGSTTGSSTSSASEPLILAYAHEKQRPGYWMQRFDDVLGT
jgi:hypothetical protein